MATTGVLEQQSLLRASADRKAKTFEELCEPIPAWARQTTVWFGMIYLWLCSSWYFQFVLTFFEAVVCPVLCASNGNTWLCQSGWHMGLPIGIMLFIVCSPAELSGKLAQTINHSSMLARTTLISLVLLKGTIIIYQNDAWPSDFVAWKPAGFGVVAGNLMGSFANTGIMPQIAADLKPALLDRAVTVCPIYAVSWICKSMFFLCHVVYCRSWDGFLFAVMLMWYCFFFETQLRSRCKLVCAWL